jgi:hypothetical protein
MSEVCVVAFSPTSPFVSTSSAVEPCGPTLVLRFSSLQNNAVSTGGVSDSTLNIAEGFGAYKVRSFVLRLSLSELNLRVEQDYSGGRAARVFTPCDDEQCEWSENIDEMPENRWYPHVETMVDGSAMIIGGELWGGFVNSVDQVQSTPTFEFFPKRGTKKPKNMTFLLGASL